MIFMAFTAIIPVSSASSPIPTYYDLSGYAGNQTIYPTSYLTSSSIDSPRGPYFPLSSYSTLSVQSPSSNNINPKNAVSVGVGHYVSTSNGNILGYYECYSSVQNVMIIYIPVTAVGSSNWNLCDSCDSTTLHGIDYEQLSLNIPGNYPSAVTTPCTSYTDGINVSSTYVAGTNTSTFEWNTMWYLLGQLPYGIGTVISTEQYEQSIYGQIEHNPNSQFKGTGNDTNGKYGMDIGKTTTGKTVGPGYSGSCGYDTYGVTTVYMLKINQSNFNSGSITVGAQNEEQQTVNWLTRVSPGAYANVKLGLAPAYTLEGRVTSESGEVLANQQIIIVQTGLHNFNDPIARYIETTNSTGYYRFFAKPGYSYYLEDRERSWNCIVQTNLANATGTGGQNLNFDVSKLTTYPVTFTESGLPSGANWEACIGSGSVGVFSNSGSSSTIKVNVPYGTYTWSVSQVQIRHSNGETYIYGANPSSGSITVDGNGVTQSVDYDLTEVIDPTGGGPGSGCVNGTTEILMANYTYMQAQYIKPGDYVLAYNLTTHSLQPEEVLRAYVSYHSRQYTINGFLDVSAYQPVMTNHGYIQAQNLTMNDKILDPFIGHYIPIYSITNTTGSFTMYDFQIPPNYDFIAYMYVLYDLTIKP